MMRGIVLWLMVTAIFYFAIPAWRSLTGKEKWSLTKHVSYTIMCSVLALLTLVLIVILF
jgi:hypothetical protein